MSDSIFEVERRAGEEIVLHFRPPKLKGLSPDTQQHIRTAQKELLLALRSLIDDTVEILEKSEKPGEKGRTKIEVQ